VKSLIETLEKARDYKFLGPVPIEEHLKNGKGFIEALLSLSQDHKSEQKVIDLGSGGGVPALVIAEQLPHWHFLLIERKIKRVEFLHWAVENLSFGTNITVFEGDAEIAARETKYENTANFVTARSFASPPVTAECGCRFLKKGGHLIVSEPPDTRDRWSGVALSSLGLETIERLQSNYGTFQALELKNYPDQQYPRRSGAIKKNPLW
tara:strand:+ start:288 stop:911 length:624 start_codon:yes stop_codon:yes gene_type:complete